MMSLERTHVGQLSAAASLALALVAVSAQAVHASNEDDFFVGDRAAMMGGAVTAIVDDGSAAFYNHAGLANAKGSKVDVSASVYSLRLYSVKDFLSVEGGPSKDASVTEFVAIPTQIAYVRELTPCMTLGLGYFVPKAENALLSDRLTVGDDMAGSTWALDTRSTTTSSWLVAALGLRAHSRVRVGFGLFGVYETSVDSLSFFGSVTQDGTLDKALEVSTLGTSTGLGLAPGAGLQLDLGRGLVLGL